MIVLAVIDLPDTDRDASTGTYGDAPDVIAEAVLARVVDEPGYDEGGNPYGPGEVIVHAFTNVDAMPAAALHDLATYAAATARGHGPL